MKSPYQMFIARLLEERDMQPVLEYRITSEDLSQEPQMARIFDFINNHFKEHLEVPSRSLVEDELGAFTLDEPEDCLSATCEQVKRRRLLDLGNDLMAHQSQALNNSDNPVEAIQGLLQAVLTLQNDHAPVISEIVGNADFDTFRKNYFDAKENKAAALSWPWPSLQEATMGIHPEDLIFIYGKEKTMKTWLMLVVAHHAHVYHEKVVLFVTQEMSCHAIQERQIALDQKLPYKELRQGKLNDQQEHDLFENLEFYAEKPPIHMVSISGRGKDAVLELEALCMRYAADIVFIDGTYLAAETYDELRFFTQGLKRLAKKKKIPVFGTCQENASGGTMHSRSFAQDCDLLLRTERGPNEKDNDELYVEVAASRASGDLSGFRINAKPATDFSEKVDSQQHPFDED